MQKLIPRVYLVVIMLSAFSYSKAQNRVPGFIGKRFAASAGIMVSPAFNPTYNNHSEIFSITNLIPVYGINLIKHAQIDYAISRTKTIGIDFQNLRTSDYIVRYYPISTYNNIAVRDVRNVFANSLGINLKVFDEDKGALAPIGNYKKYGFNIMFTRSYDSLDTKEEYVTKNILPTFTYGFGKNIIIYKYFTLNYGVDFTVMLDSKMIIAYDRKKDSERYYDAGFVRTRSMKFINSHIAIGYVF